MLNYTRKIYHKIENNNKKHMSGSPLISTPNITAAHPILLILRVSEPLVLQPAHFWCYLLSYSHAARFSRTNLGNVLLAMQSVSFRDVWI